MCVRGARASSQDEGEEKDLYQVTSEETDEEKWRLPKEMRCGACQAVAYQAGTQTFERLARRYKDELVGTATLEALEWACDTANPVWTSEYGIMPTAAGYNVFNGTGIVLSEAASFANNDVMLTSSHGSKSAEKLAVVCKTLMLGADGLEEDEWATITLEAADAAANAAKFKQVLCDDASSPVYNSCTATAD